LVAETVNGTGRGVLSMRYCEGVYRGERCNRRVIDVDLSCDNRFRVACPKCGALYLWEDGGWRMVPREGYPCRR
jgi:hypothetical protein